MAGRPRTLESPEQMMELWGIYKKKVKDKPMVTGTQIANEILEIYK